MQSTFTGVFEQVGGWYFAYAAELPGANTQGKTLTEARENLREAVELILLANRQLAEREMGDRPVFREPITVDF